MHGKSSGWDRIWNIISFHSAKRVIVGNHPLALNLSAFWVRNSPSPSHLQQPPLPLGPNGPKESISPYPPTLRRSSFTLLQRPYMIPEQAWFPASIFVLQHLPHAVSYTSRRHCRPAHLPRSGATTWSWSCGSWHTKDQPGGRLTVGTEVQNKNNLLLKS